MIDLSVKEKNINFINKCIYIFMKYLYVFILFPKIIQLIFIFSILILIIKNNNFKIYISKESLPFLFVGIIHIISIIYNLKYNHEIERIFAAFNTAFLWIFCSVFYSYAKKEKLDIKSIEKYMFNNIIILIILSFSMIIFQKIGYHNISVFSRNLMRIDWNNGNKSYRFSGFLLYDTLVPMMYFTIFPFAYSYISKKNKRLFNFMFIILSLTPVILSKSRAGILLCLFQIIVIIPNLIASNKKTKVILVIFYFLILLIFLALNFPYIQNVVYNLINSRNGSTNMRASIYINSIKLSIERNILIGCGIKDLIQNYPLGSHCTYIGLFFKCGIIGLILGVIGIFNYLKNTFHTNYIYICSAVCLVLMFVTEDLDGENWLIILYSLLYASIYHIKKVKN